MVWCGRIVKAFSYPYGTLKNPMRQSIVTLLSFGALILFTANFAPAADTAAADKGIELAQQELARVTELVNAGALPRNRLQEAEANLEDAKDEVIIAHDLYGDLPAQGAGEAVSAEMIAAAQRRVDRQKTRVDEAKKLIDAGIETLNYLTPFEAELTARRTTLDMAHLRAQLMADRAVMSQEPPAPPVIVEQPPALDDSDLHFYGMEHYEGDGVFNEARELPALELAYASKFDRPLPISADGETEVHREMGFDHRGRVDVAVVPSTPEGVWLREYLQQRKIPYYAFSHAIRGKATAAHIHIGPGSTRLGNNQLSRHIATRVHTAD